MIFARLCAGDGPVEKPSSRRASNFGDETIRKMFCQMMERCTTLLSPPPFCRAASQRGTTLCACRARLEIGFNAERMILRSRKFRP